MFPAAFGLSGIAPNPQRNDRQQSRQEQCRQQYTWPFWILAGREEPGVPLETWASRLATIAQPQRRRNVIVEKQQPRRPVVTDDTLQKFWSQSRACPRFQGRPCGQHHNNPGNYVTPASELAGVFSFLCHTLEPMLHWRAGRFIV